MTSGGFWPERGQERVEGDERELRAVSGRSIWPEKSPAFVAESGNEGEREPEREKYRGRRERAHTRWPVGQRVLLFFFSLFEKLPKCP